MGQGGNCPPPQIPEKSENSGKLAKIWAKLTQFNWGYDGKYAHERALAPGKDARPYAYDCEKQALFLSIENIVFYWGF